MKFTFDADAVKKLNYKTPYFLFDPSRLQATIDSYKQSFPKASVHYALKANSEPEVLKVIRDNELGFEVASAYELDYLKDIQVAPEKIIYGTAVKPADHIKQFVDYGVDAFAVDSELELEKIAAYKPGANVYARVLVDDSESVFTMSEKFGTDENKAEQVLLKAKELGLVPYGVSFNVGSQARNPNAWAQGVRLLTPLIKRLQKAGIKLQILDMGGGYPASYADGYKVASIEEIAKLTMPALAELPYEIKILLEPGRGLVATSMALVVTVIANIERDNGNWLYVDGGAYNCLLETMSYQGSMKYHITPILQDDTADLTKTKDYIVTGPTGDSLDVIDKQASLPVALKEGDKLLIHDVGAYSLVLTMPFNGFPKPPVYTVGQ